MAIISEVECGDAPRYIRLDGRRKYEVRRKRGEGSDSWIICRCDRHGLRSNMDYYRAENEGDARAPPLRGWTAAKCGKGAPPTIDFIQLVPPKLAPAILTYDCIFPAESLIPHSNVQAIGDAINVKVRMSTIKHQNRVRRVSFTGTADVCDAALEMLSLIVNETESATLMVENIPHTCTSDYLGVIFGAFGRVVPSSYPFINSRVIYFNPNEYMDLEGAVLRWNGRRVKTSTQKLKVSIREVRSCPTHMERVRDSKKILMSTTATTHEAKDSTQAQRRRSLSELEIKCYGYKRTQNRRKTSIPFLQSSLLGTFINSKMSNFRTRRYSFETEPCNFQWAIQAYKDGQRPSKLKEQQRRLRGSPRRHKKGLRAPDELWTQFMGIDKEGKIGLVVG